MHQSAGDVQEWVLIKISIAINLTNSTVLYDRFRFAYTLLSAFSSNGIASLQNINTQSFLPSNKANVFVTNHDTERVSTAHYANQITAYSAPNIICCREAPRSATSRHQTSILLLMSSCSPTLTEHLRYIRDSPSPTMMMEHRTVEQHLAAVVPRADGNSQFSFSVPAKVRTDVSMLVQ